MFNKLSRGEWIGVIFILVAGTVLITHWIFGEMFYVETMRPTGIVTVADYYHHFGAPGGVETVEQKGVRYYVIFGKIPWQVSGALTSSPPTYVFDLSGRLVDWVPDANETRSRPDFQYTWSLEKAQQMELKSFERQFEVGGLEKTAEGQ